MMSRVASIRPRQSTITGYEPLPSRGGLEYFDRRVSNGIFEGRDGLANVGH